MKKYLFGLGAMLVGAGLMFVLMHTEVSAEIKSTRSHCEQIWIQLYKETFPTHKILYCKIKDLTCVIEHSGTSCVKS